MENNFLWWFIIFFLNSSIQSRILSNLNESTNKKQTSTNSTNNNIIQYQSIFSTNLATITTTISSNNNNIQSLITKPNSYLYDPDEDETLLERIKREAAPFVCKTDGYFPDRQNCQMYHICTSGVDTVAICAAGTSWDPTKKNCAWENTVECRKGLRKWDKITDIRGVTLFATDPSLAWRSTKLATTRQPIKVDSNFTCEYDAEGYFPDPKYCHIYHFCAIGSHQVLQCLNNLWYSTETQGCDWPDKSDCKAGNLHTSSKASTLMIDGDGNPVTTPRNFRTNVYPQIECPPGIQKHFADPYDCSAYHYCNGGVDKPSFCDAGLFYDKKHGCQWPKDVPHCQHKCPPNGQRLRFVATHSCCHYYECINGHLKEQVCPLHKLYSVETKSCENFQVVNCGSREHCIDPCDYDNSPLCEFKPVCRGKPNGNYVDQYRPNCQFHYTCLESRTFNYTACEYGHRFSVQHQKCLPAKQYIMFHGLYNFFVFIILLFIIWLCLIKILYRNSQCAYIRHNNNSFVKQNNQSYNSFQIDTRLKLHHFTILGTHNSYHKESYFYKYEHSNLDEQLSYGIRQIELDIHLMSKYDVVYHLQIFDDKTNCYCLRHCLEKIFYWSQRNSYHYPIYLFIEIKQMFYEDLFTALNGGIRCKHFQMIKEQILEIFSIDSLILPKHIQGNQSSIRLALNKQRQNELNNNFLYENYGWPPLYISLGKLMPIFIDDVHNIAEKLIHTCEPLSNFFFIAQTNINVDYASIIRISNLLKNQHLIIDNKNSGQITRILLGYNGKQLMENYNQAKKYGINIISTDSVQCNNTELCRSLMIDFQGTSSVLCNTILAPNFCNTSMLIL
ncbi:unnamed protein product [Adineta steineri]|uniref:Chitin-binding type-2 domain-containing protein n=1 Tax=Adineta steineri TaxID=433720 RepID=A0A819F2J8_9BILA|nr:unnamed protein product [Adineta steineri]CAF3861826.1 unnamed protein product [Adineta steineri]